MKNIVKRREDVIFPLLQGKMVLDLGGADHCLDLYQHKVDLLNAEQIIAVAGP
jgi:hypothetical protein